MPGCPSSTQGTQPPTTPPTAERGAPSDGPYIMTSTPKPSHLARSGLRYYPGWRVAKQPKPQEAPQGSGTLHSVPRTTRHGWPLPRTLDWGPPMRTPLPPCFVPATAFAASTAPRYPPKHGTGSERSIPHGRGHPQPSHFPARGPEHGDGATTTRHQQSTTALCKTQSMGTPAHGPQRPRPKQGAAAPNHETHGPAPDSPGREKHLLRKSHCHVFLGGLDAGQAPLKTPL